MWTSFSNVIFVTLGVLVDLRPFSDPCYDADKKLNECLSILSNESQNFLPDDNFVSRVCSRNLLDSVSKCMEGSIQWNCAEFYYWKSIKNKYAYICKSQAEYFQHTHCRNNISFLRELGGCIEVQKNKIQSIEPCIVYEETKGCLEKSTERFCSQNTAEFFKSMYRDTVSPFLDYYRCTSGSLTLSPDYSDEWFPNNPGLFDPSVLSSNGQNQKEFLQNDYFYLGYGEFPTGEDLFRSTLSKEHAITVALEVNTSIPTESSNTTYETTTSLSSTNYEDTGTILPDDIFNITFKGFQTSYFSTIEHNTNNENTASGTTGSYNASAKMVSQGNISITLIESTDISFIENSSVESVIVSNTTADSATWSWFEIATSVKSDGDAAIFKTTSYIPRLEWYLVLYVFLPFIILKLVPVTL